MEGHIESSNLLVG